MEKSIGCKLLQQWAIARASSASTAGKIPFSLIELAYTLDDGRLKKMRVFRKLLAYTAELAPAALIGLPSRNMSARAAHHRSAIT